MKADKIIFPEENDIIKTDKEEVFRIARDYDAGDFIWIYTGGTELDMVTGQKEIKASSVLTLNDVAVIFNGAQFETI